MKKTVIYRWSELLEKKQDYVKQLNYTKKFAQKNQVNLIAILPTIFLDFINTKYNGKKISFALENYQDVSNPQVLKNLNIEYSLILEDCDKKVIDSFLKNK